MTSSKGPLGDTGTVPARPLWLYGASFVLSVIMIYGTCIFTAIRTLAKLSWNYLSCLLLAGAPGPNAQNKTLERQTSTVVQSKLLKIGFWKLLSIYCDKGRFFNRDLAQLNKSVSF